MSPRMVDKYLAQPGAKDEVVETIQTATDETLYFFTNRGNCFMLDVTRIPETMKLKDRGSLLTGLIAGLADHEHAVALVCVKSDEMAKRAISCSSPRMDRLSVPPQRNTASAARALRRSTSRATMSWSAWYRSIRRIRMILS